MADTDNKLGKLYNVLSKDANYKVGDSTEFVNKFSDPEKLGKLFDVLSKDEKYQINTSKEEWVNQFATLKKKEPTVSESLSPDGTLSLQSRSTSPEFDMSLPGKTATVQQQAQPPVVQSQITPTQSSLAENKTGAVASYIPEKHPFDYKDNPILPQYEMFEASKRGDFKKSDDIAMGLIEKNPADPYAYRMLYYNTKKQGNPSLDLLERAIQHNPYDMALIADMAFVAKNTGNLQAASQYASQIASMVPPESHDIPSLKYRDYAMGILSDVAVMSGDQDAARGFVKQREQIAEQIKEKTPTSGDWMLSQAINNSMIGMGLRTGLPEGSTNSEFDIFRDYQPTTKEEMLAGLGSLILDLPAFGPGGSIGAGAAKIGIGAYRTLILKNAAKELAKRGLSKDAINVGLSQITNKIMTSGITSTVMAASGSAGALGYYDAEADFLRQLADGATIEDVDYGQVLKRFEHGTALGLMIGPLGYGTSVARKTAQTYINRSTDLIGMGAKVTKLGADVGIGAAGFGAENVAFVGGGALLDGKDLGEITTKDWVMSFGTLAGLKGVNMVKGWIKSGSFTDDKVNTGEFKVEFTEAEAEAIRRLGYDGQVDPTLKNPEPILADPTIPQTAKMKIMWAGYGVRPAEFPAIYAVSVTEKDGKWNVITTNKEGAVVTSENFATREQANEVALQAAQMLKDVKTNEAISEFTPEQKADVLEKLKLMRVEPETVEAALDKPPADRTAEDIQAINVLKTTIDELPPAPVKTPEANPQEATPTETKAEAAPQPEAVKAEPPKSDGKGSDKVPTPKPTTNEKETQEEKGLLSSPEEKAPAVEVKTETAGKSLPLPEEYTTTVERSTTPRVDDKVTVKGRNGNPDFNANFRGLTNGGKEAVVVRERGMQMLVPIEDVTLVGEGRVIKGDPDNIKYGVDEGLYQQAIKDGHMTPQDAITIIESAGLEVPKDIRDMVKEKSQPTGAVITPNKEVKANPAVEPKQKESIHPILKTIVNNIIPNGNDLRDVEELVLYLSGDRNKAMRQELMTELIGQKLPIAKCGVTALDVAVKKWIRDKYPDANVTERFKPIIQKDHTIAKQTTKKEKSVSPKSSEAIDTTSPEIPEGLLESEFSQWVFENSNNPDDIVIAYKQELNNNKRTLLKPWQERLLEWGKFKIDSFYMFGDRNKMNKAIGSAWIAKKTDKGSSRQIDDFVRVENDEFNSNISENDVFEFIVDNPNGYVRKTTKLQNSLAGKYKKITGQSIRKVLDKATEIKNNEVPSVFDLFIRTVNIDPGKATFEEMSAMLEAKKEEYFTGFPFTESEYTELKTFLDNAKAQDDSKRNSGIQAGGTPIESRTEPEGRQKGELERELDAKIAKIDEQVIRIEKERKLEADRVAKENANPELTLEVAKKGELIGAEKANIKGGVADLDGQIRKLKEERDYLESTRQSTIDADNAQGDLFADYPYREDDGVDVSGSGVEFERRSKTKSTGLSTPKPSKGKSKQKASGGNASDWIDESKMTNETLGAIQFPELVSLVKELTGIAPIVRHLKTAWGQFAHSEGGTGRIRLHRELFKYGNETQLGKVIAHEIGHLFDWLPDKTMKRGNLLGRLSSLRDYRKTLLKETTKSSDNILSQEERARIRRQAEKELKDEYNKGVTEVIEDVTKQIPVYEQTTLTPDDILKIWNDTTGEKNNSELYEYIAGASSATKRNIIAQALKGIVDEALKGRFGQKLGYKTITEKVKKIIYPKPVTTENIRDRFRELLKDEINKRKLFDLITIREELKNLTQWWKPFDVKADAEYTKYRHSGKELYADAISVLLNNPQELAKRAPWFNRAFFNYFESKPKVKQAYEALQQLIQSPDNIFEERQARAKKAYKEGREKIIKDSQKTEKKFTVDNFVRSFVSEISPLIKKLPNHSRYGELSPRQTVRDLVERMKFINNKYAEIIYDVKDNVLAPIEKIGMDADDFGTLLEFGRNISAAKIEKPAPGGMQGRYSAEQLQYIRNKYTSEQLKVIDKALEKFHEISWNVIEDAYEAGLYTDHAMNTIFRPNKESYATFQAVDYATNYIGSQIQELKGSLKDIRNPLEATMAKMFAISNAAYRNRASVGIVEALKQYTPDDISDAKFEIKQGKLTGKLQNERGKYALGYYDKGVFKGVNVDKYFEGVFRQLTPQQADWAVNIFRTFNKGFKPLVTSWNPGFAFLFNVIKDSRRTVTNLTAISSKRAIDPKTWASVRLRIAQNFIKSVNEGSKVYKGEMSPIIKEMMDAGVFDYRTGVLSRYNADNSESIDIIASRIGMGNNVLSPTETSMAKNKVVAALRPIVDWYFKWASALEIGTKINAYEYLKNKGFDRNAAAFYTRNYTGTPNYKEGGFKSKSWNEYLPFSTVIIQGLRNDFSLASKPETAGAYWFDMTIGAVLPATATALAGAGMFGDDIKKLLANIPDYYKYNYFVIPIGKSETGKTQYFSIPMDEVSRLIYAATYGMVKSISESEIPTVSELQQIGKIGIGFIPSASPLINIVGAWMDYIFRGKNPTDNFRGNDVIRPKNFNAGGWPATKDMLTWSLKSAGGNGVMSFFEYDPTQNTTKEYVFKNIPIISRIYRESSAGDADAYREINERFKQGSGKKLYEQDRVIDDIISKFFEENEGRSINESIDLTEYNRQMDKEYFGTNNLDEDQRSESRQMQQKLKLKIVGGIKGNHQQLVLGVINAYNTDAAVEMIRKYKENHSEAEYMAVIKYMQDNRIKPNAVKKALSVN